MSEEMQNKEMLTEESKVEVESKAEEESKVEVESKAEVESIVEEESKAAEETKVPEESMADYQKELEASFRRIKEGDILTGTVISVNEEAVILDLNYYAPGIIKAEDMSDDPGFSMVEAVKLGDKLEASVVKTDDGAGNIRLSRKEATGILAWGILKQYKEEEKDIAVKIGGAVNGGVIAYVEGIRGFIPASQLALQYVEDVNEWIGREVTVRIITLEEEKQKLVLSAKAVQKEKAQDAIRHKVSMMAPGTILEGKVESLMPYGAFVSLQDGLSGLVHISQISQKRIKQPSEVLKVGETVKVKVLNTTNGKISLSIKAVEDGAAEEMEKVDTRQYSSKEEATTSLGALLANIKL